MATKEITIKDKDPEKDIILFVGKINNDHLASVAQFEELLGRKLKIAVITSVKKTLKADMRKKVDILIHCNMNKSIYIEDALMKYHNRILTVLAKSEYCIEWLTRVAPFFPYLRISNNRSLRIASDKMKMRETFLKYYPKISPKFIPVKKYSEAIVKQIIKEIDFPCVIKPTNLASSKLIINCFYKEELEDNLKEAMKKIKSLYKKAGVDVAPNIIVEEFMEGQMYSIDAYVNSYGKMYFTPIIEIKTGKDIGYDDLFMYTQITPSLIGKEDEKKAQEVVTKGTHAIGIRSSAVHCELMKTAKGWKIIEMAARPGGFRDEIFQHAYGFGHHLNDILIHLGNKPIIKKKPKRHVVFMKFWPKKAGSIKKIKGLQRAKQLKSIVRFRHNKKVGDYAGLSKNGHLPVIGFTLATKTRSGLMGDIRKLEKWISIETSRNGKKKKI